MPSPHPAVAPKAIAITKHYGKNVSRGIFAMEKIIIEQAREIEAYSNFVRDNA